MPITHIVAPARVAGSEFKKAPPTPAVDGKPVPQLSTKEAYSATGGEVATGIWEASPGTFRRAVMDAEFSHFISGHATFAADDGNTYEFRAGDAAYFPPFSRGVWTVHETLRKTYCVWKA